MIEFSLDKVDELIRAQENLIPFDNPNGWKDWIKRGIDSGQLNQTTVILDGEPVGLLTWIVTEEARRELLITSFAIIRPVKIPVLALTTVFAEKLAKQNNCHSLRFHTIRKGMVKQGIALGFNVSEIILRKTL